MAACGPSIETAAPSMRIVPAEHRIEAEQGAGELRPAGADQSREAENLAAPQRQLTVRSGRYAVRTPATSSSGAPGGAAGGICSAFRSRPIM